MKLRLTLNKSVDLDLENSDLHEDLANALAAMGLRGLIDKEQQSDIEEAMQQLWAENPDGILHIDEEDLRVEVLEGTFDIGDEVE